MGANDPAESRNRVLANIRQALGGIRSGAEPAWAGTPIPPRTNPGGQSLASLFSQRVEQSGASLATLEHRDLLPGVLAGYMRERGLEGTVALAPPLARLDWSGMPAELHFGPARGDECLGVAIALCGIAETGSLVLTSGPDGPTRSNFLPEHHLVLVARCDLLASLEDAWARLRETMKPWPRTVNLITGPSRTADVEQTIQIGAHGPRSLHVLLLD